VHLKQLGWNEFFEANGSILKKDELMPARVIRQLKKIYWIHDGSHEKQAVLAGKFYKKAQTPIDLPVVGDWIGFRGSKDDDQVMIREVLPRKSQFVRKAVLENTLPQVIAANIDTTFIINGLDRDFNLRRIERYLSLTYDSGAVPVIILNKTDICEDVDSAIEQVESIAFGADVIAISAKRNEGVNQLLSFLKPGCTVAFIGSSGVGKSTLVNLFMKEEIMDIQEVRKSDQRGRHTTTHRELFILPNGAMIIDTPGLRELQLWGSEELLTDSFSDIETLSESCRFSDCQHDREPDCSVKKAVETGTLDPNRYASYMKLKRELAYLDQRQDEFARRESRRQSKILSKMIRQVNDKRDKPGA